MPPRFWGRFSVKLLPALLGIAAGHLLRLGVTAERCDADSTFRLIINILLPTLAFTARSQVSIDRNLAIFPLAIPRASGRRRSAAAAEDDGPRVDHRDRAHLRRSRRRRTRRCGVGGWMRLSSRIASSSALSRKATMTCRSRLHAERRTLAASRHSSASVAPQLQRSRHRRPHAPRDVLILRPDP